MNTSVSAIETILPVILFLVITVIPVRLAADLFGVVNAKYTNCTFAVLVGTAISYLILRELAGNPFSYAFVFAALVLTFRFVLKPNLAIAIGLTVVSILIQVIVLSALFSLGKYMNADMAELLPFFKL